MIKCKLCNVEPTLKEGRPVNEDNKTYWRQIYTCSNPQCPNHNKEIGEVKINIFDNSDVIEKDY